MNFSYALDQRKQPSFWMMLWRRDCGCWFLILTHGPRYPLPHANSSLKTHKLLLFKNEKSKKWWMPSVLCLFWLCRPWASCYCPTTSPTAWSTCPRWWMTSGTTQAIARQTWVASLIPLSTFILALVCSSTGISSAFLLGQLVHTAGGTDGDL